MRNIDELLLNVQKPARYIGGEWNAVKKEWRDDIVKFLIAFPDAYEVGMSHLGIKILYGILNERDDCLCERVFSPWPDFENILRKNKLSLFSLESRKPIKEFDIIGFSLAYELSYTNVLNILDLGGIPVRSSERNDNHPLIIAGGTSSYNPEPMAEFIDAFVIGEGEEVIGEIVDLYKGTRVIPQLRSGRGSRKELLRELAKIEGVYVPSLYEVGYNDDGRIKSFEPSEEMARPRIKKRVVKDFENSFYPVKQIVPYIQTIHDRITLEIMRGCKRACKFCQARAVYWPCRERSKTRILRLADQTYKWTGYDEISLLSLSSGDHSQIIEMIEALNASFKEKAVSVSMPSLRVEDVLKSLPLLISQVKKSTLTFAPEVGSDSLREIINKRIDMDKLHAALLESFRRGWRSVKLYFMIGLPTEKAEDILEIAKILNDISESKRGVDGTPAHVTASVNAFVPKPHTSFQRQAMEGIEALTKKAQLLKSHVRSRNIKLDFHSFRASYVEAVLSRGDRRLSSVIYGVWQSGGRFDAWDDFFDYDRWIKAFEKSAIDPDFYATRPRDRDEVLPWAFIDTNG